MLPARLFRKKTSRFTAMTAPYILALTVFSVKTDYQTEFVSAGINQINYKIWLNLSMDMKVVNPLYQETITLNRKIMLCDLVFSGKVPEHYFQFSSPDEYLLTE